ncbi:glycosyltransferase family A protein [Parasulfitobacter algicola]|uniref:Glycosyltransferase family 2 protein n=1 Tax=Parasulfitobacter algicola TaxID=2614809 RepID=A0ABX2IVA9_9RHOB|nr:glycosyltransferase family A protein [Sulfitobacter algicola]NSX53978.1 glycosyltransferase family 2 protein [Sulfitobacter algicola]
MAYSLKHLWEGKAPFQRNLSGRLWQWRHTLTPPSTEPMIYVAIPLVAKDRADDWSRLERILDRTLKSLLHQTNPNWQAVICGQNEPDLTVKDPRIRFLKYPEPSNFSDQRGKLSYLVDDLKLSSTGDGYYFALDADDILHPELFSHIQSDNNGQGYYLSAGYMIDAKTSQLAPLYSPHSPLYKACGSSTAMRFDFRSDFQFEKILRKRGKHGSVPDNVAYYGFEMQSIAFPSVLYLVNHGENMQKRRGKIDSKLAYISDNLITDQIYIAKIREEFKLDTLDL